MVDASAEVASPAYPDVAGDELRPLREHRAFITVFILSAMLSALALTYIYSERYRAENVLYFKTSVVPRLVPNSTEAFGSPVPSITYKIILQTITGLVESDAILRGIVTDLHLDYREPRDYSGPWYVRDAKVLMFGLADFMSDVSSYLSFGRIIEPDPVSSAISGLRKQIKVVNNDSYLYILQVNARTPQLAASIADHLGVALLDLLRRNDLASSGTESKDAVALRDAKLREIEDIETKIRDLLTNTQVVSIKEEIDQITQRASKLQQDRSATLADLRQSDAKVAGLAEKLRLPGSPEAARDDGSPATHRLGRLTAVDYAKLTSDKLEAEVNSRALRGRLDSLERSYAALVARFQVLNQTQAEDDVMTVRLKSAARDYATLTDVVAQTAIKTASGPSELRIQEKAQIPRAPLSPIKMFHVLAAGGLAAMIAIGLAYVFDFFDIRLFLPPGGGPRSRGREPPRAPAPETVAAHVAGD
jgi:uncharacterized protein involved in exopolysaccharide biosynthesis